MAKITFDSIAGGELAERFKIALAQVGRNILDPNMDPEAKKRNHDQPELCSWGYGRNQR